MLHPICIALPPQPDSLVSHLGCSQAFDLPETESHGGLLGYERQDLYLSMSMQAAQGREQKSTTRVQEGMNGTVTWAGEKISIKCSNADDTVTAEVWKSIISQRTSKWSQSFYIELKKRKRLTRTVPQLLPVDSATSTSSHLSAFRGRFGTRILAARSSLVKLP